MKKIIKIITAVIATPFVLCALFFIFVTVAEYRPKDLSDSILIHEGNTKDTEPGSLSILTWNIGYAGLDKYTDFVLDGGKMGKPRSRKAVETALAGVSEFVKSRNVETYLLQEVDRNSSRSYHIDETEFIASEFDSFSSHFSTNFRALFVPFPLNDPIKKVESGILTINHFENSGNVRLQLPGYYSWPVRTVHLKRCIMETRIPSPVTDKDWVVINVHLTAYGNGDMRIQQLEFIKKLMLKYYAQGHFIVIGGDWNSLFPGVSSEQFAPYLADPVNLEWLKAIPDDWTPAGWKWGFDINTPTARLLDRPYEPGETFTCIIDGFLVSPNVNVDFIKAYDLGFEFSDHNPVEIRVSAVN